MGKWGLSSSLSSCNTTTGLSGKVQYEDVNNTILIQVIIISTWHSPDESPESLDESPLSLLLSEELSELSLLLSLLLLSLSLLLLSLLLLSLLLLLLSLLLLLLSLLLLLLLLLSLSALTSSVLLICWTGATTAVGLGCGCAQNVLINQSCNRKHSSTLQKCHLHNRRSVKHEGFQLSKKNYFARKLTSKVKQNKIIGYLLSIININRIHLSAKKLSEVISEAT